MARESSSSKPSETLQEAGRAVDLCAIPAAAEMCGAGGAIENSPHPRWLGRSKRDMFVDLLKLSFMLMNLASELATVSNNLHAVDYMWMLLRNAPLIAGCIKDIRRIVSPPEGWSRTSRKGRVE